MKLNSQGYQTLSSKRFCRLEIPLFRDSLELGDIHEEAEAMLDFLSVLRRVVPVLVMLLIEAMEKQPLGSSFSFNGIVEERDISMDEVENGEPETRNYHLGTFFREFISYPINRNFFCWQYPFTNDQLQYCDKSVIVILFCENFFKGF